MSHLPAILLSARNLHLRSFQNLPPKTLPTLQRLFTLICPFKSQNRLLTLIARAQLRLFLRILRRPWIGNQTRRSILRKDLKLVCISRIHIPVFLRVVAFATKLLGEEFEEGREDGDAGKDYADIHLDISPQDKHSRISVSGSDDGDLCHSHDRANGCEETKHEDPD